MESEFMKMLIAGALVAAGLMAQSGPPTYDYDLAAPGTQGPVSPLLNGYTYRSVRQYQIAVPVLVPVDALQAALPPGFVPIPTAPVWAGDGAVGDDDGDEYDGGAVAERDCVSAV
jgi:hypothetical protein